MQIHRSIVRRRLDRRLLGLADVVGARPPRGWAYTIRRALGMTTGELAQRLAVSQSRASQLERAEVAGSIRMSTLRQVAAALECQLVYAFVPDTSLERIVRQQARRKVAEENGLRIPSVSPDDQGEVDELVRELLDALALERVDTRGLWRLSDGPMSRQGSPSSDGPSL